MSRRFIGKNVVITGGNSGIGLAAAKAFVAEGAFVFIVGRNQVSLDAAVAALGGEEHAVGFRADVGKVAHIDAVYADIAARNVKLDVIVANAGVADPCPTESVTEEHFDRLFNINTRGAYFTVQRALPLLNDGGTVVLVSSVAHIKGPPGHSVYAATKAALRSFARTWTSELKSRQIRVNVVSPGPVDTPIIGRTYPDPNMEKAVRARMPGVVPAGRLSLDTEQAAAILFLASSESSFVWGADLFVDGGFGAV